MLKFTPFILFILCSCSQRMKVPINKMISPEVIGHGIDLEYRNTAYSEALLDFSNDRVDNPVLLQKAVDREVYMAFGIAKNADIFIKVPKESSSMLGLKLQLIGASSKNRNGSNQLAVTYARGAERDTFTGDALRISLKSDASEISLIHGFRYSPYILFYEAISISKYEFNGFIKHAPVNFSDSKVEYTASNILGAQLGVELGGINFKSKFELGLQRIEWSNTEAKSLYAFSYAVAATF